MPALNITLSRDRLEELLRAAWEDGYDDATAHRPGLNTFEESVTKDQLDALVERVLKGGRP